MGVDTSLSGLPEFQGLEILKTGSSSLHVTGSSGDSVYVSVPHNLGFSPQHMVFLSDETGTEFSQALPMPGSLTTSGGIYVAFNTWLFANCDNDELFINAYLGASGDYGTFNFKYVLFRSRAK